VTAASADGESANGKSIGGESAGNRVLGRLRGRPGGPLLLVTVGIHGNEPAGIAAARLVLERLQGEHTPLHGELLVLLGNRAALQQHQRYVQRDLNRGWTDDNLARLRSLRTEARNGAKHVSSASQPAHVAAEAEDLEQLELLELLEPALADARTVFTLDLHTTSATGFPFSIVAGSPGSSDFALGMALPSLRGILERVDGLLAEYLGRRGCIALAVEGGQNEDARSIERLQSVLTVALAWTGVVESADLPDLAQHRERLQASSVGLPRVIEIHRRHALGPGDDFRMEPGFANLQRIRGGTLLARDRHGEIRAEQDGWLIFPLYQSQGDDGFFLGRELDG